MIIYVECRVGLARCFIVKEYSVNFKLNFNLIKYLYKDFELYTLIGAPFFGLCLNYSKSQ